MAEEGSPFLPEQRLPLVVNATSEAAFSRFFDAFTNPHRLAVMRELRMPRTLGEIVVRENETGAPLARQSVRRQRRLRS